MDATPLDFPTYFEDPSTDEARDIFIDHLIAVNLEEQRRATQDYNAIMDKLRKRNTVFYE